MMPFHVVGEMIWFENHVGIDKPEHILFESRDCVICSKSFAPRMILILELNNFCFSGADLWKRQWNF